MRENIQASRGVEKMAKTTSRGRDKGPGRGHGVLERPACAMRRLAASWPALGVIWRRPAAPPGCASSPADAVTYNGARIYVGWPRRRFRCVKIKATNRSDRPFVWSSWGVYVRAWDAMLDYVDEKGS